MGNQENVSVYAGQTYNVPTYVSQDEVRSLPAPDAVSFKKYGIIALIYAVVHTVCLYRNTSGITYPLSMAATILLLAWARKQDGLSIIRDKDGKCGWNIFYIISLMLLSVSKCTTANADLLWIDGLAIDLLVCCFLLHMYVDTKEWDIIGWFIGIMLTVLRPLTNIVDPVRDLIEWFTTNGNAINAEKKRNAMAVILGLCIAVPMLTVVLALLSSADAIFSDVLNHAFDFVFKFDSIWDIIGVTLMLLWSIWLSYTVIKTLSKNSITFENSKNAGFNPVIAITFSSLLCCVYLLFSVIQIVFLFMGNMTLPEKYTYAEYAHEGFYQLVVVAVLNFIMVTLCQRLFRESRVLKGILTVVGLCTYIMLASSAFRMLMYIKAYHLTFMRVFVLWFLVVLALCLSYLIAGMFNKKLPVFKLCMATATVLYVIFVFSNPDLQIARYDLACLGDKEVVGSKWDSSMSYYLTNEISEDAVPAFVGNKSLLMDYANSYDHDYRENKGKFTDIRKFNFSKYRAYKILDEVKNGY